MIRVDINKDGRCEVEVNGEASRIAFEFAMLTSKLVINMPEYILEKSFEDGLYISKHGMDAFGEKMDKDIKMFDSIDETLEKIFRSEESETEENADDNESDNESNSDGSKDFAKIIMLALVAAALLGNRNDKSK